MTYLEPILPAFLVLTLAAFRLAALRRSAVWSWAVLGALWIASTPVFPELLLQRTERQYSGSTSSCLHKGCAPQAIVVLASSVLPPYPGTEEPVIGPETRERCDYAALLSKKLPGVPVLASGGGTAQVPGNSYAEVMRRAMVAEGVPESAIAVETTSRSTYENARNSAQKLSANGLTHVLLVTSAYHMPRATAAFRKQGISVTPAACDYRVSGGFTVFDLLPSGAALELDEVLLHEWIGSVVYRWKGWI